MNLDIRKNILISRFYKRFWQNGQNLAHFGSSNKFQTLLYIYKRSRVRIPLGPNVFFTSPGAKHIEFHHLLGD